MLFINYDALSGCPFVEVYIVIFVGGQTGMPAGIRRPRAAGMGTGFYPSRVAGMGAGTKIARGCGYGYAIPVPVAPDCHP